MFKCTYINNTLIIKSFTCISIFIVTFNLTSVNANIYIIYIIIIARHRL